MIKSEKIKLKLSKKKGPRKMERKRVRKREREGWGSFIYRKTDEDIER